MIKQVGIMILNHKYRFLLSKQRRTGSTSLEMILSEICSEPDVITKLNRINEDMRLASRLPSSQNHLDPEQPFSYGIFLSDNANSCLIHNTKAFIKCLPYSKNLFDFQDPPSFNRWTFRKENLTFDGSMPVRQIRELIPLTLFNSIHKFTVVRNPFDQILSWYFWQISIEGQSARMDFSTLLKNTLTDFFIQTKSFS